MVAQAREAHKVAFGDGCVDLCSALERSPRPTPSQALAQTVRSARRGFCDVSKLAQHDNPGMPRFMLDRELLSPPGYAERGCVLVRYRLPGLRYCFVLCQEDAFATPQCDVLLFCLTEAERLAADALGDPQAFMLIHSGSAIRKRANWHLHVFVVRHRWQKAWVYTVLGAKNLVLAALSSVTPLRRRIEARPRGGAVE